MQNKLLEIKLLLNRDNEIQDKVVTLAYNVTDSEPEHEKIIRIQSDKVKAEQLNFVYKER